MNRQVRLTLIMISLLTMLSSAWARRDPLNAVEQDELREAAQEPDKRIKLYLKFARVRMEKLDRLNSDPRLASERSGIHDLLQDIGSIVDELSDNIDAYIERKSDMRKSLKEVIDMDGEFSTKLRSMKGAAKSTPAKTKEAKDYEFVLDDVIESLNSNLDLARKTLEDQEAYFKTADKKKK